MKDTDICSAADIALSSFFFFFLFVLLILMQWLLSYGSIEAARAHLEASNTMLT